MSQLPLKADRGNDITQKELQWNLKPAHVKGVLQSIEHKVNIRLATNDEVNEAYFQQLWHDTLQGQTCPALDRQRALLCDRGHPEIKQKVASSSVHQTSAQEAVELFLASCLESRQHKKSIETIETLKDYTTSLSLNKKQFLLYLKFKTLRLSS